MAETVEQLDTRISAIDAAIDAVLLGQSHSLTTPGGEKVAVTKASLDGLRRLRSELAIRRQNLIDGGYPTSGEAWR